MNGMWKRVLLAGFAAVQALPIIADEDMAVAVALTGTDVESGSLAYSIVTPPVNGTLTGTPPSLDAFTLPAASTWPKPRKATSRPPPE